MGSSVERGGLRNIGKYNVSGIDCTGVVSGDGCIGAHEGGSGCESDFPDHFFYMLKGGFRGNGLKESERGEKEEFKIRKKREKKHKKRAWFLYFIIIKKKKKIEFGLRKIYL